ncbi:MerR family transcriptional regulator [Mycobacteroides abscessus]|uniref:MerR family transcriptional regulator n=1 Tax=Mycobacteroides abscessus TaxID=36809 RepID=UPI00030DE843|nr:MerR family transcriptional regulator [Mycobacteroides abscessus]RIS07297.1 MerR family transcriptional regulator [Mycobacteroides abscessus]SID22958.1 Possible thiol-specific antioxidant related protein/Peroxidoxin BcpB [Mycobacteroides abscessus subsp. abscessus]SIM43377.1 Possible thiol-specific antioxidant related protein/Peroxidoxin BcpB [Mycobacteroides abscessus subsp. abscessus]
MQISELARRAGVSLKAVRYYERLGLVMPSRLGNGYRDYTDDDLQIVGEIRSLAAAGISPSLARPFIECLREGHDHSDDCPSALAAYRDSIAALDQSIASLIMRRRILAARLDAAAARTFTEEPRNMDDYTELPFGLPVPVDDGAADHLQDRPLPDLTLMATGGCAVRLRGLPEGRTVLYLYPLTGRPGLDIPEGWDAIPGARGCTTEACGFRDHFDELRAAGAQQVWGLSSQDTDYQAEVVRRLRLPFHMLSDPDFTLAEALHLPTFAAVGHPRLYARITLIVRDGRIEQVFYPIFPPDTHAQQVLEWLTSHPMD